MPNYSFRATFTGTYSQTTQYIPYKIYHIVPYRIGMEHHMTIFNIFLT